MPTTSVALYRRGNTTAPLLDNVRPGDVGTYMEAGVEHVIAKSGGISCNETGVDGGDRREWSLAQGVDYPDELYLRQDDHIVGHWFIEPAVNMSMPRYKDLLATLGSKFKCTKTS
jgi:hypothetical protein